MAGDELVGPIVGPLGSTAVGNSAARYIRNGAAYDCAIGGLPFVMAPSDDRPYARETADFRTQQIDTGSTVGDQSLTGYWTRGQFSFHRGSGVKFYEILDGDSIPNRFSDSLNVDPWTAGELTLKPSRTHITSAAVADAVTHDGKILTLSDTGAAKTVTYTGTAVAKASSDGGAFSSIASDGVNAYGTNAGKIEHMAPGGAFSVLWTHGVGGRTWTKVWWAKDRLWAVDNTGEWYTLSTAGGTTAGGDVLWTSLKTSVIWSLADSEGGVFIAQGSTVYLATVDTSTVTPTLVTPTSVATVGFQETIATIGSYLGYLLVASNAGLRLGRIQGGGVLLGALITDVDATGCSRVAYRDDLIMVSATDNTPFMYEVNVLEQVADLLPAFAPSRSMGASAAHHGVVTLPDSRVATFSDTGIDLDDTGTGDASGFVQTGFHRFGTMEPKDFRTLTVRAEGAGGSIGVEVVKRDGTAVGLVTLGLDNFYDNEISLNLSGPTDYIGLRFTITSVGGDAPTLLGYQLRAIPAPARLRMIQVPLMCFDKETVGGKNVGRKNWARDRLFDLEDMEQDSGAVTYQDFRTGETATVSIDKIQFQNRTPAARGDAGFGGYLVVTMRKIT